MARFTINLELESNRYIELTGDGAKFWEGLPTYEGSIEGLQKGYPEVIDELLKMGIIKHG